jgi:U4/U6 small nuclear ribonucleoprotein PRP4
VHNVFGRPSKGHLHSLLASKWVNKIKGDKLQRYQPTFCSFLMVTGSGDNTCKVWDVRMRRQIYTMPSHQNLVSRVRIDPSGEYMVTGSYDNTMKLWTSSGWQPLRVFDSHNMKARWDGESMDFRTSKVNILQVTCVDISPDENWIVSSCYDRTFKLWSFSPES